MNNTISSKIQSVLKGDTRICWKEGALSQIYLQSFKDTAGDGFGDFKGVIAKRDYLESLGITMVWMNLFFESAIIDRGMM